MLAIGDVVTLDLWDLGLTDVHVRADRHRHAGAVAQRLGLLLCAHSPGCSPLGILDFCTVVKVEDPSVPRVTECHHSPATVGSEGPLLPLKLRIL